LQNDNKSLKEENRNLKNKTLEDATMVTRQSNRNRNVNLSNSLNYNDYDKQYQIRDIEVNLHQNRMRDLERQLDDYKKENNQNSNTEFVSFRPNYKRDISNKENIREKDYSDLNRKLNAVNFETFQNTSSLENFKRNKVICYILIIFYIHLSRILEI
jgi:hypothetical protein